jgi:hypothetical protein
MAQHAAGGMRAPACAGQQHHGAVFLVRSVGVGIARGHQRHRHALDRRGASSASCGDSTSTLVRTVAGRAAAPGRQAGGPARAAEVGRAAAFGARRLMKSSRSRCW